MILTARQLEDLYKADGSNGQVVIPYRARLTPLAQDWIRAKKVKLGYADVAPTPGAKASDDKPKESPTGPNTLLWWCDGPCGPAKAALMAQAKETAMSPLSIAAEAKHTAAAVKAIAADVKAGKAAGGILIVKLGAAAMVYANRCPSLRAILGTCMESVDQGVREVAANVLVIEHPYKNLPQVKNLLARFAKGNRELSEDVKRQLGELSSCG